jgi:hypothetical protein
MKKKITLVLFVVLLAAFLGFGINLPTSGLGESNVNAIVKPVVPQKMLPGSIIIYNDKLQPIVVKGGYVKDSFASTPQSDILTSILDGLREITITADMSPEEKAVTEWENKLVSDVKDDVLKNGVPTTQPYSPPICPGAKVVYNEDDGYIDNIYYPDPDDPSGYSIHNIPSQNKDNALNNEGIVGETSSSSSRQLGVPYGAHNNVIYFQYSDDSFLGEGRATYFTDKYGNRNNILRDGDCATVIDLDYSKVGDKDVYIRNLNTDQVFIFHQADVGGLPDAVIDIWGLNNLRGLAGDSSVYSVYKVRYYHKRFSDQTRP